MRASFKAILILLTIVVLIITISRLYKNPQLSPKHKINLGLGWANNTINTVIFRHHGILTQDNFQYTSFYDADGNIRLVKRNLTNNSISKHELDGDFNTSDAHNAVAMGIDREGFLHISYNQHANKLNYIKSNNPYDINSFSEVIPMTGVLEDKITYPTFIMNSLVNSKGGDLLFLYRDGVSGNGDAILKRYDIGTQQWTDIAIPLLKGSEQIPWRSSPYWNSPVVDSVGRLILSYSWRVHGGPPSLVNNVNINYLEFPDAGKAWQTSRKINLSTPVTPINSEVIWPIPPGSNLINQTSSAVDSKGNLHIAYYADDENGIPQYQHLWFDGKRWQNSIISERKKNFELRGGGTLQIPISRPEIVIDRKDNVYFIYRGDLTEDKLVIERLKPPSYQPKKDIRILWPDQLGYSEPVIDRIRWQKDGILSMLIQKNYQPNHDIPEEHDPTPVFIVDWDIVEEFDR